MKKYINKITVALTVVVVLSSCSDEFLDKNLDPNVALVGDIDLMLPVAQTGLTSSLVGLEDGAAVFVQQSYELGASTFNITNTTYGTEWDNLYSESMKDIEQIIIQGTEEEAWTHVGVSQVLKGFVFHHLTDYFGDIPYSEALQGETILNPTFDDGASIYTAILALMDAAIVNLEKETNVKLGDNDLLYRGDVDSWIALANTIKLKMALNLAQVNASTAVAIINNVITDGRLVGYNGVADFELQYGSGLNPHNRHPRYSSNYDGAPDYVSNYIMLRMAENSDPRIRHYFYRQSTYDELTFDTTPCSNRNAGSCQMWEALVLLDLNYMGRDQGDNGGIPGDNDLRTAIGLYPYGGKFDNSTYATLGQTSGALGAGVKPMFTRATTDFMLAEAVLTIAGVSAPNTAREYFISAMDNAFAKVRSFGLSSSEGASITDWESDNGFDWDASVTNYTADRLAEFDLGGANSIEAVMNQKYFSNFGNALEAYTDFRRTGYPNDLPDAITAVGPFPVRLPYPTSETATNSNSPADVRVDVPVFWDIN